ncbi:MAG: IS110 family transposase [Candidatus Obscuribacter sp.]|nr:IS110 family transposase [Candidatus Obscuribacter sp.]
MLKTIPGFDVLTSIAFIAEVGDISRFRKANQVAAFLGLAPRVYSSGDTRRNGRITKCGSKLMRWMLVQSAWSAIRGSSNLRACYSQIGRRRGHRCFLRHQVSPHHIGPSLCAAKKYKK